MTRIVIESLKYILPVLFACYSFDGILALLSSGEKRSATCYNRQTVYLILMHLGGNLAVYTYEQDVKYIILYVGELFVLIFVQSIYNFFYYRASRLLCNHMCMLLAISFIMLSRLDYGKCVRQLIFAAAAALGTFLFPFVVRKSGLIRRFGIFYAIAGIVLLLSVMLFGGVDYGANLSLTFFSVSVQPSEFIKILFVFFVAGMLQGRPDINKIVLTAILAAVHVLILVASRDLGAALIFYVAFVIMLFAATRKYIYLILGVLGGGVAGVIAYFAFSHVRTRVIAFLDPLSVVDDAGYQVAQSLFAIGNGGYFGTGLYQGYPGSIPVVTKDFIFSAIVEEMGGIFAIFMIFSYAGIYLMFVNLAMQMRDRFYKLLALGLGTVLGVQTILNIGGAIKALPSTGVTLPLVSYGGSSLLASFIIFAVIQGLYMQQMRAVEAVEKRAERSGNPPPGMEITGEEQSYEVYFFMVVFALLIAHLAYFISVGSSDFVNNSYNKRIRVTPEYMVRGSVLTSDGVVVAANSTEDDGTEKRVYPAKNVYAHAVGFLAGGGMGVERTEGFGMLSTHEFLFSRIINDVTGAKNNGDNCILTLDDSVQKAAWESLGDRRGAVVAMEVSTGKIIAMVSKPDFDPESVSDDWADMNGDSGSSVFVNRVTNGSYPPGSVFKIVTALEYLREKGTYDDYSYECTGAIDRGDGTALHCYANEVHGKLDIKSSFAESCNTSFANIGGMLDRKKWAGTSGELLFGKDMSDVLGAGKSLFLLTEEDTTGKVYDTAIGQGDTVVTPLHMCMIAAGIKNDGVVMKPYLVDRLESVDKVWEKKNSPEKYANIITRSEAAALRKLMDDTVYEGTAKKLKSDLYEAGGKTGSAEYGTSKGASHGWFAGYGSNGEKEDIAIAVIVEDGNTGAASAVPVTKAVFDTYFSKE